MTPIFLRNGRQLFVDDYLILESNLKRTYHFPESYEANPVLESTEPWERTNIGALYAAPFSDGVWYDETESKFKMWYMAGAGKQYPTVENAFYTCYAESDNGIDWIKENQDILPGTNAVELTLRDAASIWLDKMESDPVKRFKMFLINRREGGKDSRLILKYSKDGIHWSPPVAHSGKIRDRFSAFLDPFNLRWVLSLRHESDRTGKARNYAKHEDPEALVNTIGTVHSKEVFWFGPDGSDPSHPRFPKTIPGIYNFDVIAYESLFIGFYTIWQGPSNEEAEKLGIQKRNEVNIGFSRDGFNFEKSAHKIFFGVNESLDSWNWGNVQSTNGSPIVVGDHLYFYFSGRKLNKLMWDSHMSTGLVRLRRDGFTSMKSEEREGFLLTKLISYTGHHLFVNADVSHGELKIEVLDNNFQVIPGFSKEECRSMCFANKTKYKISWHREDSLNKIRNKPIYLKFYLSRGDLYAFWMSPFKNGESLGFTAGGGPNLHQSGRDIPSV